MKKTAIATALLAAVSVSSVAQAEVLSYDWTGVFTMIDPTGNYLNNGDSNFNGGWQTEISGTMDFDNVTNSGTATVVPFGFFGGGNAVAHDITVQAIGDGNGGAGTLVAGNMLFDWNGNNNINVDLVLDAGGFFTSDFGFQPDGTFGAVTQGAGAVAPGYAPDCAATTDASAFGGPTNFCTAVLSDAPVLMATVDGNPFAQENVTITKVEGDGTITTIFTGNRNTDGLSGIAMDNGPFPGFNANFDVRTMSLTNVTSAVPVPAAVWLFGSGLVGLAGVARRRKTA